MIRLKRAYDPVADLDGERILVERLWPRGVARAEAQLSDWLKDLAPSTELRKWYGHRIERWPEFRRRYADELQEPTRRLLLDALAERARNRAVTLVFGAKDREHNSAVVLKELLEQELR